MLKLAATDKVKKEGEGAVDTWIFSSSLVSHLSHLAHLQPSLSLLIRYNIDDTSHHVSDEPECITYNN